MTRREIIESAKQLPRDEQLDLAMEFWEIVDPQDGDFPLTDAQKAELDQRIEDLEKNPTAGESWEIVRKRIEGSL